MLAIGTYPARPVWNPESTRTPQGKQYLGHMTRQWPLSVRKLLSLAIFSEVKLKRNNITPFQLPCQMQKVDKFTPPSVPTPKTPND